jgi:hypothetical protein
MTSDPFFTRNVLITVKAYPNPSTKYGETVCVAGVTREDGWIRLYPVPYRDLPYTMRFRKYQWVSLRLEKHRSDTRPESFRPDMNAITPGKIVSPERNWAERKRLLFPTKSASMCELLALSKSCGKSLGMFRPGKIMGLDIEDVPPIWSRKQEESLGQGRFFSREKNKLEKIPVKISFRYVCDDAHCKGHKQWIIDWEVAELYRNLRTKYADIHVIKEKIRRRLFDQICGPDKDTHFFVGNMARHRNVFLILGLFYPRREAPGLFE